MRPEAVVIVNPNAGRLSETLQLDVIQRLRSSFDIEVHTTTGRDDAIELTQKVVSAGARLVIAFGGDGLVNEVANGVAATDAALGIIPGGTMNVFARALRIPLDPLQAVAHLDDAVARPPTVVPLGRMDDRYFTFSAGCGFDAEAAERVEEHLLNKRRFGELFFYWSAFRVLAGSYRHRSPWMTLSGSFGELPVAMAIASNTGPYAYFLGRPVNLAPAVELKSGLDVFALRNMRVEAVPLYVWRVAISGDFVHHPDAFYAHDLETFELRAERPFSRHVDGEPLGPARQAHFSVAPDVLKVQV